jgi:hypothetical protein
MFTGSTKNWKLFGKLNCAEHDFSPCHSLNNVLFRDDFRFYANTTPFYINDFSIRRFLVFMGSWNRSSKTLKNDCTLFSSYFTDHFFTFFHSLVKMEKEEIKNWIICQTLSYVLREQWWTHHGLSWLIFYLNIFIFRIFIFSALTSLQTILSHSFAHIILFVSSFLSKLFNF